ncbi:MAG: helix-turn-helix domain-containing protein [Pseudomonadota bacterium]
MDDVPPNDDWFSAEASTFGDRMAGAREKMGMSRSELAKRLGVKTSTIASWEEDLSEPRANKLQMLSGILNVSLTWLLTAEGDGLSGPVDDGTQDANVQAVLTEMRQMKAELQRFTTRMTVLEKQLRRATKDRI